MNDFATSLIRTYAPIVVGGLLSYLATLGLEIDPQTQAGMIIALTGVLQSLYYFIARKLEAKNPRYGEFLLGSSAKPKY